MTAVATRADRVAALLDARELDALLVTHLVNVRYLTGYTGSNGLALVGPGDARGFVTDFRYRTQAEQQVQGFARAIADHDLFDELKGLLPAGDLRLGVEHGHLPVQQFDRLRELLGAEVELVRAGGIVEELRAVKDDEEVARIAAAAELADAALLHTLEEGLAGRTERAVALTLEFEMQRLGARCPSFKALVVHGPQGALPHGAPRDVEIAPGSLVTIDWGAELDGYCSDCTRTYAAGEPGERAREIYELVALAQRTGLAAIAPGVTGRDADAAARAVIEEAGQGEHFGHGLGHGVGLEVHEGPRLSKSSDATLAAGNVVTVEPGIYLPGELGVRIEDLVVVTEDGHRVLNGLPKELEVVG